MSRDARHYDLAEIARQAMIDRGFEPDFGPDIERELDRIKGAAHDPTVKDLTNLPWCSIDNDDSRDLDQLTVATDRNGKGTTVLVAIADVDALVKKGSAIDGRAHHNTTSVYTPAAIFPMLPEKLSTDLTSLGENEERLAVVVEITVDAEGSLNGSSVYRARVRNQAKLAYHSVGDWLEGEAAEPEKVKNEKLEQQLQTQDKVAQALKEYRHEHGALDLDTIEPRAVMQDGTVVDLNVEKKNRARDLIEDFMIAANGVTARFLKEKGFATLRRVVRSPERWERIVQLAAEYGDTLPPEPDSIELEKFLLARRKADPLRFPDLSLAVVKLMGRGEYVVEKPGTDTGGHFGLAVRDYTHSTAPNRRYPDLVTQRLLKAALDGKPSPYADDELEEIARHCTEQENASDKVERQMRKVAAAQLLQSRVGERFDAIVTGASSKGTWVRIFRPPVEGRVVHGYEGMDVGERVRVKLIEVDVERGFIDFVKSGH